MVTVYNADVAPSELASSCGFTCVDNYFLNFVLPCMTFGMKKEIRKILPFTCYTCNVFCNREAFTGVLKVGGFWKWNHVGGMKGVFNLQYHMLHQYLKLISEKTRNGFSSLLYIHVQYALILFWLIFNSYLFLDSMVLPAKEINFRRLHKFIFYT